MKNAASGRGGCYLQDDGSKKPNHDSRSIRHTEINYRKNSRKTLYHEKFEWKSFMFLLHNLTQLEFDFAQWHLENSLHSKSLFQQARLSVHQCVHLFVTKN